MELDLATTEELANELLRRSKTGIILLDGVPYSGCATGESATFKRYQGHLTMCLGHTLEMQHFLHREMWGDVK